MRGVRSLLFLSALYVFIKIDAKTKNKMHYIFRFVAHVESRDYVITWLRRDYEYVSRARGTYSYNDAFTHI